MNNIHATSDQHHGHTNIIKYCDRPFDDTVHMSRELIARHNAVVAKDDIVLHVGDFSLQEKFVPEALRQMNGTHKLVMGNHDRCHPHYKHKAASALKRYLEYGFVEVCMEMRVGPFLISHMPYLSNREGQDERYPEFRPKDEGSWLLHGHIHGRNGKLSGERQIDVGVDLWNYAPVRFEVLLELMDASGKDKKIP